MSYAHIVPGERVLIESECLENRSRSYIAAQLKRSKSTIHYELICYKPCKALLAQADYDAKRGNYGCERLVNPEGVDYILFKLKLDRSSESIVGRY